MCTTVQPNYNPPVFNTTLNQSLPHYGPCTVASTKYATLCVVHFISLEASVYNTALWAASNMAAKGLACRLRFGSNFVYASHCNPLVIINSCTWKPIEFAAYSASRVKKRNWQISRALRNNVKASIQRLSHHCVWLCRVCSTAISSQPPHVFLAFFPPCFTSQPEFCIAVIYCSLAIETHHGRCQTVGKQHPTVWRAH